MNALAARRRTRAVRQCCVTTLIAAVVVAGSLLVYDRFALRPALASGNTTAANMGAMVVAAVGVVDVAEVYRAKEAEFTLLLTTSSSEEERQKALQMARVFAQRLPAALDELPRDCACLVLVKSAVAGVPPGRDLTPLLRRKVQTP